MSTVEDTLRELLDDLVAYVELVQADITSEQTGWYYHLLGATQRARRALAQLDRERRVARGEETPERRQA